MLWLVFVSVVSGGVGLHRVAVFRGCTQMVSVRCSLRRMIAATLRVVTQLSKEFVNDVCLIGAGQAMSTTTVFESQVMVRESERVQDRGM